MDDKVIVTNRATLTAKYGASGVKKISAAIAALVAADAKRGVKTRLLHLDDAAAMKKLGVKAVASATDQRGTKAAIDGIFGKLAPDYLMILGSVDVVPHQDMTNPAFAAGDDDDRYASGDLPYACDAPYGRDPARFVGPTRVVGRLPDLTGAREPSHVLALLKTAAGWSSRPAADYQSFGLSAAVWQGSTRLSLENVFGSDKSLALCPPKGPKHPASALGARMHFINCHGATATPEFYGQKGNKYPLALTTATTRGAIRPGTVASVECCYGGQLYDSETLQLDVPICQSYLRQGAYGYLGSTTIAYGPANDNGAADLLCQYFLLNVLAGASTGRAALMARQQFVAHASQMDPIDLKTLAQFCLLGDPSVHPVAVAGPTGTPTKALEVDTLRFRRHERRAKLKETGDFLKDTKPTASKAVRGARASAKAKSVLASIAARAGLARNHSFAVFKVKGAKPVAARNAKSASAPSRYFVSIAPGRSAPRHGARGKLVAVVAKEVGGRIIDYRIYEER